MTRKPLKACILYSSMSALRHFLLHEWIKLVVPLSVFAAVFALGYVIRRVLFRGLRAWVARSGSRAPRILTTALHGPFLIWALILALHLGSEFSELPPRVVGWGAKTLLVLWILSVTVMFARIAGNFIRYYGSEIPGALPVTTLTQNLAQLGVVILGLLVMLNQLGIPITPILTALGVGGLAVALALQDTLSNLFAGFYVAVAGQVRLGDYIKLNTGEEGYVTDISWRSTTIRALSNNLIIVPNAKLAQAVVTNFHLPETRMAVQVQVAAPYDADPDQVERVLAEVASRGAAEIPGMLAEPAPSVAFDPGFGESAMVFSINCHVQEFVNQFGVRNELRRRILRRFREEGIGVAYPARAVHLRSAETRGAGDASS